MSFKIKINPSLESHRRFDPRKFGARFLENLGKHMVQFFWYPWSSLEHQRLNSTSIELLWDIIYKASLIMRKIIWKKRVQGVVVITSEVGHKTSTSLGYFLQF